MNFFVQFDGDGLWRILKCNVDLERKYENDFKEAVNDLLSLEGFEDCRAIAIDMSHVAMIAFNALPMLAQFFIPVKKMRRKMYVTGLASHLRKIIDESGIGSHVIYEPSIESAKRNFTGRPAPTAPATAASTAGPSVMAPRPNPDVQFLNSFVSSALESIKSMAPIDVKADKPFVKTERHYQEGDICGQIYVRGERFSGPVTIALSPQVFEAASRQILTRPVATMAPDFVADARAVFIRIVDRVIFGLRAFGWTAAVADLRVDCVPNDENGEASTHSWPTLWLPFDTGMGLVHIGFGIETEE